MKRDATGKFTNSWNLETKQQVSISLTSTAWRLLEQEAQKREISRSEIIERFARSLQEKNLTDINEANAQIALLQDQLLQQQQEVVVLQRQKQQLEALLESKSKEMAQSTERKVATILESITDAFVAFDRDWYYTYVNQAAAQILCKTPEELIGKHVWNDVFPELVDGIAYQLLHQAIAEQIPVSWEEFGEPIQSWLEVNAYPSIEGIAIYFRDVTERKQVEIERERLLYELATERTRFETVLQKMPAGVLIADAASGKLLLANEQAKQILKYNYEHYLELEDYRSITPYEAFRPNEQIYKVHEYPLVRSLKTGEVITNEEMELRYEDGQSTSISVNASPILDKQGQILASVVIFQDITHRQQTEMLLRQQAEALEDQQKQLSVVLKNLQQTEERLHLALSSAQMFAWDGDLKTSQVVCSPNALEVWGMQVGTAEDFYAAIHSDDRQLVKQAVEQAIVGDQLFVQEYRAICPDGLTRWIKSQGRVHLDESGQAVRMTGISVNITELKQIEADREALLEKLQRKERQQQFLIELNDAIRTIQDPNEIIWRAINITGQYFNVTRCTYGKIDLTQSYVIVDRDYCNGVISVVGRHYLDSFGVDLIAELKQGKTVVVDDVEQDVRTTGVGVAAFDAIQTKSLLCVPLVKEERFVALFVLHHVTSRHWTKEDVALMERVAEKIWLAVERSQAEEKLRESEAHLQLAVRIGRMGTWDWDIQTGKALWSEGHFTILGLQPNEGEPSYELWANHVHPDDLVETEVRLQCAMLEHTEYHHEYRILWPNGSVHWVEARGQFTYDAQGHPKHSIGAIVDITARKQVEQEREQLLERERIARSQAEIAQHQLATIFETSPVGMALLDAQQRFIAINEALAEINGLTRQQHLGCSIPDLFGQSDPKLVEVFHQIYSTGVPFISPSFAVNVPGRRDRSPGYYNVYYLPNVNSNHQVEDVLVYVVDVTERIWLEQTQQFLAEASAVLSSSLDYETTLEQIARLTVPELADWCTVHMVEEDGTIDQIAVAHSDPAKLAWAYQIQDKYPLDPNDERGAALTLRTGQPDFVPEIPDELLVYAARDPEHLEILRQVGFSSFMSVPLRTQARIIGVISFISAESGRKYTSTDLQLAEELARRASLAIDNAQLYRAAQHDREKAEAANRIKDEFLAVLSHELRSPLNPILGWTRMLRSKRLDVAKVNQALETIERNAKLQAQLIEDLLDVSRILQGKMVLNVAPVNLATTIQAALETVRLAAEAKHIQIQTILEPLTGTVSGDANRLQQIVWNLLSNAVKFTPSGGRVEVRLEQLDTYAWIRVKDTGKGINSEFLPYVFDYFRQEDGTTTRQFGGLGLGLAIVRQLTELHGGTVSVESPGQNLGATFTVRLPLNVVDQEEFSPTESVVKATDLSNIQVLVVDDDADMRDLASFILTEHGANVITAASAIQALTILQQSIPDLLLCDIGMPEMNGYSLIQQIRKWPPQKGGTLPAIALTAYVGEINQQQALAAGFQLYISKPVEPERLVQAIARLLRLTA